MSGQARGKRIVWARRGVQGTVLILFLALVVATRGRDGAPPGAPVNLFFDLDPLVLLATWLATHTLAGLSLLALATVALTVLLGRVFCGWVCPFGTLHQTVTWIRARARRGRPAAELSSPWQRTKYLVLIGLVVMALLGSHWIGILDPFSMLYRSTITTVLPAAQRAIADGADAAYAHDLHLGPLHLTAVTEPIYRYVREHVLVREQAAYSGAGLVFALLITALALNLVRPRFWCRYICPLGALLGLCARRPALRLENAGEECRDCGLCAIGCPAAAQPERPGQWLAEECFGCWNCVAACKWQGIDFAWRPPWRRPAAASVDLTRRAVVGSVAAGVGGLLLLRMAPPVAARGYEPRLIRPPGARPEDEFLDRCIQCGQCMQVCPTNALHPTLAEAGLAGLWTPVLIPRLGYCEYECNLCGQVCPTGAIEPLALAAKQQVKIGLATIDTGRCLPYAFGRDCIVCEEHCPIPDKAIYFVSEEVVLRDGSRRVLKQPRVDANLCTGCGICEKKCPFADRAAIRVTSAGESRHPDNRPLL